MVPVSATSIEQALELNGVAIEANKNAFTWGRRAAVDLDAVVALTQAGAGGIDMDEDLDTFLDRRAADLVKYANSAYAERYRQLVEMCEMPNAKLFQALNVWPGLLLEAGIA